MRGAFCFRIRHCGRASCTLCIAQHESTGVLLGSCFFQSSARCEVFSSVFKCLQRSARFFTACAASPGSVSGVPECWGRHVLVALLHAVGKPERLAVPQVVADKRDGMDRARVRRLTHARTARTHAAAQARAVVVPVPRARSGSLNGAKPAKYPTVPY